MNQPKIITFSISKDLLIITYELEGKEINAMIPAFTLATYLVNLYFIQDRSEDKENVRVRHWSRWMDWREFIIEVQEIWFYHNLPAILYHHIETETLKTAYHNHQTSGNEGFAFN